MSGSQKALDEAQRCFDRGQIEAAAWLLRQERSRAVAARDFAGTAEIDEISSAMRQRLLGDERLATFDAHLTSGPGQVTPLADNRAADVTPLSFGIVLAGAALMLIAVFLPQFESTTFSQIEKNSLIQNGDGWWFIGLAVGAAGTAYRAYRNQQRSFAAVVMGAIGIGVAVYYGTSHSQRELCSAATNFNSHCTLGTPGIGIYAAGVGGVLALIGGWQIYKAPASESGNETVQTASPAPSGPPRAPASTIAERLRTLDQLRADNVITDAEHARRRAALIDEV